MPKWLRFFAKAYAVAGLAAFITLGLIDIFMSTEHPEPKLGYIYPDPWWGSHPAYATLWVSDLYNYLFGGLIVTTILLLGTLLIYKQLNPPPQKPWPPTFKS
jgi:hypothetical protein